VSAGAFHRSPEEYARSRAFAPEAEAQIRQSLAQLLPAGVRVADLGAGTGRVTHLLLRQGYPVVAYDLSRRMLTYLVERRPPSSAPLTSIEGDLLHLPFARRAFPAAVCVHVLHLLPDWRLGLSEALRVVEPGGILLLGWTDHVASDPRQRISLKWKELLSQRGLPRTNPLSIADEVVPWLQQRGLPCRAVTAARWTRERSPQDHLKQIEERLYPFFLDIPEPAFDEVFAELKSWAERNLAPLDRTAHTQASFVWQVVSVGQGGGGQGERAG